MDCYACKQRAIQRCSLCGNHYCSDHGGDFCADCLNPANAAPSGAVFRFSVLAILVVSVFALWLLVRPPGLPSASTDNQPRQSQSAGLNTPAPSRASRTTPSSSPTPVSSASPAGESTPAASSTPPPPTPTPTPGQAGLNKRYTVVPGDTLYDIALAFGVTESALAGANGLSAEDPLLQIGQELVIPQ